MVVLCMDRFGVVLVGPTRLPGPVYSGALVANRSDFLCVAGFRLQPGGSFPRYAARTPDGVLLRGRARRLLQPRGFLADDAGPAHAVSHHAESQRDYPQRGVFGLFS